MKTLRADNEVTLTKHEAAIDRLQASNEKAIGELRTAIEGNSRTLLVQIIIVVGFSVALLAGLITILQFIK